MVELEPIDGVASDDLLHKFAKGATSEFDVLKGKLDDLKLFILELEIKADDNENLTSTEAASQHIGYLESKIMESIGTIDKIALELASQIDRRKDNANTSTSDREGCENLI